MDEYATHIQSHVQSKPNLPSEFIPKSGWQPGSSSKQPTSQSNPGEQSTERERGAECQRTSFMLLNAQSMNPSASSHCRYKIQEIEALVGDEVCSGNLVPFIAITETWLENHVADAQISLMNYNISRCDRKGRGGGVLLYSHESSCY